MSLAVVGADFPNKKGPTRRFEIALCAPGEIIELRPEPRNTADPNAIAVYSIRGVQLGYITAERAPYIGRMLSNGRAIEAAFQCGSPSGCWIRLAFDGAPLIMPPPAQKFTVRPKDDPESGFWADEIPVDE